MQDVRQSLKVQLEQGAAKGLPAEGLGKERAKAGGPYVKLSPWLRVGLGLGLGLGERQTLRSRCGGVTKTLPREELSNRKTSHLRAFPPGPLLGVLC